VCEDGAMKVLHIWNTAGVASIIAKFMDRFYKTESTVLMKKSWDKYGFTTYGELIEYKGDTPIHTTDFFLRCLKKTRNYDVIHVHGVLKILPMVKVLYPKKTLIAHFHGTDIRGVWKKQRKFWRFADAILYSSHDMESAEMPKDAVYMPNPVDTDFFYEKRKPLYPKTAFHISYFADGLAKKFAKKYGLQLVIHNRESAPIPYGKFADVLCLYEYYMDVKRIYPELIVTSFLSKTGLEALACNRKVINGLGKFVQILPEEHMPENVAKQVYKIYLEHQR
jgi:hypothetical protein